ncbi:hypothetical protein HYPSUDRAFT_209212 [Hypholoma sublateritium FD-334 SS-4]|uniref:Uncharacterized protein n=1 Tax=Hypholoma sublateritium (strain FD-334 SS-4) TaxID=945553 RepID=A0A0D2NZH5_HYPSF|nr:hypothetical protein HYPSUDRAFT_209212 [Hypholoma sublateritium FD-334 SS-4]
MHSEGALDDNDAQRDLLPCVERDDDPSVERANEAQRWWHVAVSPMPMIIILLIGTPQKIQRMLPFPHALHLESSVRMLSGRNAADWDSQTDNALPSGLNGMSQSDFPCRSARTQIGHRLRDVCSLRLDVGIDFHGRLHDFTRAARATAGAAPVALYRRRVPAFLWCPAWSLQAHTQ